MPSARAQLRAAAAREGWWGGAQTASPAKRLGRGEPQWQLGRVGQPAVEQRGGAVTGRCHETRAGGKEKPIHRGRSVSYSTGTVGFSLHVCVYRHTNTHTIPYIDVLYSPTHQHMVEHAHSCSGGPSSGPLSHPHYSPITCSGPTSGAPSAPLPPE